MLPTLALIDVPDDETVVYAVVHAASRSDHDIPRAELRYVLAKASGTNALHYLYAPVTEDEHAELLGNPKVLIQKEPYCEPAHDDGSLPLAE